jgi:hypothetical protein
MTYEVLVIIVAINAIVTISLWRKVASKSNRGPNLNKKAATALWRSEPIIPKHDPPKKAGAEFSSLAGDVDRLFFADFKEFANVVNWWLADEYLASGFRLQDLPAGDLSLNVDFNDGPRLGRSFAIYYNQTRVGKLEISPAHGFGTGSPEVYTSLEMQWARFLGFAELSGFLGIIAWHVTGSDPENDDPMDAERRIQAALTRTLWDNYRISEYDDQDDEQWGELAVSFRGKAFTYFQRRDAPARPGSRQR